MPKQVLGDIRKQAPTMNVSPRMEGMHSPRGLRTFHYDPEKWHKEDPNLGPNVTATAARPGANTENPLGLGAKRNSKCWEVNALYDDWAYAEGASEQEKERLLQRLSLDQGADGILAALGLGSALASYFGGFDRGAVLGAITLILALIAYALIPSTNRARDEDRKKAFKALHLASVLLTLGIGISNLLVLFI